MNRGNFPIRRLWQVILPLLTYYVLYYGFFAIFLMILPDSVPTLTSLMLAGCVTIPFIYWYYTHLPIGRNVAPIRQNELAKPLICIAIIVVSGIVLNVIASKLPLEAWSYGFSEVNETLSEGSLIIRILSNVFIVPFLEELLFRGVILGQLSSWFNRHLMVVVSALIFGALHFNVIQFTYAAIMGVLLGELFLLQRRVLWCYMAHALTNLVVMLIYM